MQGAKKDWAKIVEGLSSKSDKIRALESGGMRRADIARYLGVRYQYVRNVLVDSKLRTPGAAAEKKNGVVDAGQSLDRLPSSKDDLSMPVSMWVEVDQSGSLQMPDAVLECAGIRKGSQVNVRIEGGAIVILSQQTALDRARAMVRQFVPPGVSLVEELFAERRREAELEEKGAQCSPNDAAI